jgi:hypothetical protein
MELQFTFTLEESQIILNALTKEPYKSVVDVIDKLQLQAKTQMAAEEKKGEEQK